MGLRDMANEHDESPPYDVRREIEGVKRVLESHGQQLRNHDERIDIHDDRLRDHDERLRYTGEGVAELNGTVKTGFQSMSERFDMVIASNRGFSARIGDAIGDWIRGLDNKTTIIVALIVGAVALIGFGGASAFRAGFGGAEIGVTSEQPSIESPAAER